MAEKLNIPVNHEGAETSAGQPAGAETQSSQTEAQSQHHEERQNIEAIRAKTETEAVSSEQVKKATEQTKADKPKEEYVYVSRELKAMAYQRTMKRIRKHLSPLKRLNSKFIHQPIVNALSEVTGKTVGRPSGLLGGGLLAFVGSSVYYYMSRHYGYDYHANIFLALLVAGFIVGWLAEVFWKTLHRSK